VKEIKYENELGSDRDLILRIIKSCEYYDLGETKSLEIIERIANKKISIKTFYNYKKILYKNSKIYETKLNYGNWISKDLIIKSYLLYLSEDNMQAQFEVDKLVCKVFPEIPKNYREMMKDYGKIEIDTIIQNFNKLKSEIDKTNKKELDVQSIPKNATIKKEFIKCGKKKCGKCPHGPYYYAYWNNKMEHKLNKIYLGVEIPSELQRDENLSDKISSKSNHYIRSSRM